MTDASNDDRDHPFHIVELDAAAFVIQHPLRERLGGGLFSCQLHQDIAASDGPPRPPGRYRVIPMAEGGYAWQRADNPGVMSSG